MDLDVQVNIPIITIVSNLAKAWLDLLVADCNSIEVKVVELQSCSNQTIWDC
jgi:hypothetical protein